MIRGDVNVEQPRRLAIHEGRRLFEEHVARSPIIGGTKNSTQKRYRTVLDKLEAFAAKSNITDWHGIDEYFLKCHASNLEKMRLAPKTVYTEINVLKAAFKWLSGQGLIQAPPLKLQTRKPNSQRAYCYKTEEVEAMLSHCDQSPKLAWLRHIITALASTGMRIEELLQLRCSDIDLENKILTIADESGFADRSADKPTTKSGRTRELCIRDELVAVFQAIPRKGKFVFVGPRGGRLRADTVRNVFVREVIKPLAPRFPKKYKNVKGFEDGRLHSFRHYFCSICANSGKIPERVVMAWVGHADSQMVQHYYHLHSEESRRKMRQINPLGSHGRRPAEDAE